VFSAGFSVLWGILLAGQVLPAVVAGPRVDAAPGAEEQLLRRLRRLLRLVGHLARLSLLEASVALPAVVARSGVDATALGAVVQLLRGRGRRLRLVRHREGDRRRNTRARGKEIRTNSRGCKTWS
jgi:hypothetical protein